MASYQFLHIDTFGRNPKKHKSTKKGGNASAWSARDIVNEATRVDGNCDHVEIPQAPILRYGIDPQQVVTNAELWAETERDEAINKQTGEITFKKLRADAQLMIGGVITYPADMEQSRWDSYRDDAIEFLKQEFGESLRSVVEHTDEKHPHIHFYVTPKEGQRISDLHPGIKAQRQTGTTQAYKLAMADWQTKFYDQVSSKHGMLRDGPKRKRWSRQEWRWRQLEAERLYQQQQTTQALLDEATHTKAEADVIKTSVAQERDALSQEKQETTARLDQRSEQLEVVAKQQAEKEVKQEETAKQQYNKETVLRKAEYAETHDKLNSFSEKARKFVKLSVGNFVRRHTNQPEVKESAYNSKRIEEIRKTQSPGRKSLERLEKYVKAEHAKLVGENTKLKENAITKEAHEKAIWVMDNEIGKLASSLESKTHDLHQTKLNMEELVAEQVAEAVAERDITIENKNGAIEVYKADEAKLKEGVAEIYKDIKDVDAVPQSVKDKFKELMTRVKLVIK